MATMNGGEGEKRDRAVMRRLGKRADMAIQDLQLRILALPAKIDTVLRARDVTGVQYKELAREVSGMRKGIHQAEDDYTRAMDLARVMDLAAASQYGERATAVIPMHASLVNIWDAAAKLAQDRLITGPEDILSELEDQRDFIKESRSMLRRQLATLDASKHEKNPDGTPKVDPNVFLQSVQFHSTLCARARSLAESVQTMSTADQKTRDVAAELLLDFFVLQQELENFAIDAKNKGLIP